ncbi:hemin import ATP-binding protein HmuV [Roseomonas fluvialis]|uniref:Hemin import ATP-binding protein HmuV n=2 Tax=Roseomonas fluvialis TaxID=1750527 RepID=A0ABM7XY59_9PROT|nr:heme ABC transporter ATP-binding protein [Roseomonas fluvialis]BDG70421.1 hemin import ATP-binding protein HmuV [Roseomonas fluvialis]
MIAAEGIGIRAGRHALLEDVSLALVPGEVVAVVGPNGAGKSTLLRVVAGELTPHVGRVSCEGRPLSAWTPLALARRRAVVTQHVALAFPMTVAEVVGLGRLPWRGTAEAPRDAAAVLAALAAAGVGHLAGRTYPTLSGGERQRVQCARALAQLDVAARPAALLLDEPTASLDVKHSAALLALLRRLARDRFAILVVLHDLNEVAFVADQVAVLDAGRLVAFGPTGAVLQPALLERVYGIGFRSLDGVLAPAFGA